MMDKKKHCFEVAYLYIEAIFRCPLFILSCVAMLMRVTYSSLRIDAVSFYLVWITKQKFCGWAGQVDGTPSYESCNLPEFSDPPS